MKSDAKYTNYSIGRFPVMVWPRETSWEPMFIGARSLDFEEKNAPVEKSAEEGEISNQFKS